MVFAPIAISVALAVFAAILAHLYLIRNREDVCLVSSRPIPDLISFDDVPDISTLSVDDSETSQDVTSEADKEIKCEEDVCLPLPNTSVKRTIPTPPLEKFGYSYLTVRNVSRRSKGELKCKEVADAFFNTDFVTVRPPFLMGSMNLAPMEYDLFACVDINGVSVPLAIEFNGQQHYTMTNFHSTPGDLIKQQERDKEKKRISNKFGIYLISVHYSHLYKGTIDRYLKQEFNRLFTTSVATVSYI